MVTISKIDSGTHEQQLLDFFSDHKFMGVVNAQRVFAQRPSELWVAEKDGEWVGALLSVADRRPDGLIRGCVENCLVDERHRREGVARSLMEAAEAYYRGLGLVGMEFAVRKNFEPNQQLIASGYRVIREYKKDKRDWDGNLIKGEARFTIRKGFTDCCNEQR